MSAHAGTVELPTPLPPCPGYPSGGAATIMPGPLGLDSPVVPYDPEDLPLFRWYAWMDLVADREAGRPSTPAVLRAALGGPLARRWGLWWLAEHADTGCTLLHRARVCAVLDGGQMLLSACGLSLPWHGPDDNVAARIDHPRPPRSLIRCLRCVENDPAPTPHKRTRDAR